MAAKDKDLAIQSEHPIGAPWCLTGAGAVWLYDNLTVMPYPRPRIRYVVALIYVFKIA